MCGAVSFSVEGELPSPDSCHCTQCRKFSGHYFVSTDVPKANLKISGEDNITWFPSKKKPVRRGFCSTCGSSLFWEPTQREWIGVAMGAFDGDTGTKPHVHVFVAEKGDYYELNDGVPQHQTIPNG